MRRRTVIRLVVFLLLGAIVNVAVAWGLALRPKVWTYPPPVELERFEMARGPWSGRHGEPDEITSGVHHRLVGEDILLLRGVSQKYDDRGVLVYWIDGAWIDAVITPTFVSRAYALAWYLAGLPCRSMQGSEWSIEAYSMVDPAPSNLVEGGAWLPGVTIHGVSPDKTTGTLLPLKPLWPGFAINTLFHAVLLWLPLWGVNVLRRRRRLRRGQCPACGYPMGTSPVCTECGHPVMPRSVVTSR